jgi:release factor glutamine methyltransferase
MNPIARQLADARAALKPVAGDVAALEARLLASHAWGMTQEELVMAVEQAPDAAALQALIARRLAHEPLSQIIGTKDFWKDSFRVTRDVLSPRPDSETMIEALIALRPEKAAAHRILDLGSGSGCLLLSSLREYENARGLGIDRSLAALAVATHNARKLQLAGRSMFVEGDWCDGLEGTYDVVLANPPYIPSAAISTLHADVRDYEPHGALDGGADGLDCYRLILNQLPPYLAPDALLLFEVGEGQAADVASLGQQAGFRLRKIVADLAGIPRIVALEYIFTNEHHPKGETL